MQNSRIKNLNQIIQGKFFKQSFLLLLSTLTTTILAFLLNILITNKVSVESFGTYRYIVNFQLFLIPIVMLGFQYSLGRLIAVNDDPKEQKEIVGIGIFLAIFCSFIGFILTCLFIYISPILNLDSSIQKLLFSTSFLIFLPVLMSFSDNILQGLNKIRILSLSKVLIPLVQLIFLLIIVFFSGALTINDVLLVYFLAMAITLMIINLTLSTKIGNLKYWIMIVKQENMKIGFHIYIGTIFGVTVLQGIIFFTGNIITISEYGNLSLAITLASPLAIIPTVLGTVLYKRNANSDKIDNSVLTFTIAISIISLLFYSLFLEFFFSKIYDFSYIKSLRMAQILSLGYLLNGLGNFFNKFLSAQSKGKEIKVGSIYNGILTIIFGGILIPTFGVWGTIFTILLSSSIYLFFMYFYYQRTIRSLNK